MYCYYTLKKHLEEIHNVQNASVSYQMLENTIDYLHVKHYKFYFLLSTSMHNIVL